jgi:serine/threonine-protein phosphatase PP1 catalytic subunit
MIERLTEVRHSRRGRTVALPEAAIRSLLLQSRAAFMAQPMLLRLQGAVTICGDVKGYFDDSLRIFFDGGARRAPPQERYLFLGNYVGGGLHGIETVCLLLAFKVKYPDAFFMLRGSAEEASINRIYGFYDEVKRRYNIRLWKYFNDTFNCLPVCAVVDERIFCAHGGLPRDSLHKDLFAQIEALPRPTSVPDSGLLCDLLWATPDEHMQDWGESDRGVSFAFGPDVVDAFLNAHGLQLVCCGQQVLCDGYHLHASRRVVSLFTAPNYRGELNNMGATMRVDDLDVSFRLLKPAKMQRKFLCEAAAAATPDEEH